VFYDRKAQIQDSGGDILPDDDALFDCAIDEIPGGSETARGERYDADFVMDIDAAPYIVRQPNRKIVVGGVRYAVVSAVAHDVVPHVEGTIAELRPGG
jgi:hypothetical protein